jgi:tricarballylate dehydrogenase
MSADQKCDVIVIGGGSAAFDAAVSAKKSGAGHVVMLEKAPEAEYGGNARYSGTGFRFVHDGAREMRELVPDLDEDYFRSLNINPYTREATGCPRAAWTVRSRKRWWMNPTRPFTG